jgi:hypothetical protein
MNRKFHGVFSLGFFAISIVAGCISILGESMSMGLLYVGIMLIAPLIVIYSFCSKCICRLDGCGHLLPGKLTKYLPEREQGPYTFWDIFWTVIPLIVLFLFPQFWLWKNKILVVIFWSSCLIGLFELLLFVCKNCTNENCPVCIRMGREGN